MNDLTAGDVMNSFFNSSRERDFSAVETCINSLEKDVELGEERLGLDVITRFKRLLPIEIKLLATTGFMGGVEHFLCQLYLAYIHFRYFFSIRDSAI